MLKSILFILLILIIFENTNFELFENKLDVSKMQIFDCHFHLLNFIKEQME